MEPRAPAGRRDRRGVQLEVPALQREQRGRAVGDGDLGAEAGAGQADQPGPRPELENPRAPPQLRPPVGLEPA